MSFTVIQCTVQPTMPSGPGTNSIGFLYARITNTSAIPQNYSFSWTGGISGGSFPVSPITINPGVQALIRTSTLLPGVKTLTITELATGEVQVFDYTIIDPVPLVKSITTVDAGCTGTIGSITFNITGGNFAGGNYQIFQGATILVTAPYVVGTPVTYSGITPGTYGLRWIALPAAGGCGSGTIGNPNSTSNAFDIHEGEPLTATLTGTNPVCDDAGYIIVSGMSGQAPYTFSWICTSEGDVPVPFSSTSQNIYGLTGGTYQVTITDALGCTGVFTEVLDPGAGCLAVTGLIKTSYCGNLGNIFIEATGGTGPYTYLWSNGETSDFIQDLIPDTYTVVVTDSLGVEITESFVVPGLTILTGYLQVTQPTASSSNTGSIQVIMTDGSPSYTYDWNTGATTSSLSDLEAGTYSVTVTNTYGCTLELEAVINLACDAFDDNEFKVFLMRIQCCYGKKILQQISFIRQGRQDLADCMLNDLMLLDMIIQRFYAIESPGNDTTWSCEDIEHLMGLAKSICECDCCSENQTEQVTVIHNSDTNEFNIIN